MGTNLVLYTFVGEYACFPGLYGGIQMCVGSRSQYASRNHLFMILLFACLSNHLLSILEFLVHRWPAICVPKFSLPVQRYAIVFTSTGIVY